MSHETHELWGNWNKGLSETLAARTLMSASYKSLLSKTGTVCPNV